MELTHFGHACLLVQTLTTRLLIDPGTLHADHLDLGRLPGLLEANPRAVLLVDPGSAPIIAAAGLQAQVMEIGDRLRVGGSVIGVVGGAHALVHRDIPVVPN